MPIVPPTVASAVTANPVPVALLNVNVSAMSAVLLASNAPLTVNVSLKIVAPEMLAVPSISNVCEGVELSVRPTDNLLLYNNAVLPTLLLAETSNRYLLVLNDTLPTIPALSLK